jgi:GntR family transcriptional regulator, transcriptional repressor for pyruvate dehydrogenase complex
MPDQVRPARDEPRKIVRFAAIKQPKAAQLIAGQIRSAVRSGELRDGDRLPSERELILQFGYSRAVVREALRVLEDDGLIKLHVGRSGGAVISMPGPEQLVPSVDLLLRMQMTTVAELYEARRLLEPLLVALAAERATDADLAELRECLDVPVGAPRDAESFRTQNNRFHRLLADAAHNNALAMMTNIIMELSLRLIDTHEDRPGQLADVHRRIIDALAAHDGAAATEYLIAHLKQSEKQARSDFTSSEPGIGDTPVLPRRPVGRHTRKEVVGE